MTNSNRRQLARVRNVFLGATALAGVAALSTPASAVVINNNFTPAQIVDTTNVTGIGQMVIDEQNGFIGLCTATLINPRTVIFASHCVNENPAGNAFMPATGYGAKFGGLPIGFFFNSNNNVAGNSAIGQWLNGIAGVGKDTTRTFNNAYNSNFVVYDTQCCTIGLHNNFLQADVAMAALDTPAVGIPTWTVLFSPLAAPVHATIAGYGDNGTGTTGQGTIDFKRRVAENIISVLGSLDDQDNFLFGGPDGLPANLYMVDFNDPKFNTAQANQFDFNIFHDTATTREGITAPGDSGGPLIVDHAFSAPTIAAVLSGGDRFFGAQPGSSYGTTSFYQPLYLYWDWIVANNPYKYVNTVAGNGNWTDASHWVMGLDPAYMTISNGQLVNGLPTTKAAGIANIPPGFGLVCFFNDCINIVTGVETNPTPAPGPNPTDGSVAAPDGAAQFAGMMSLADFRSMAQSYVALNGVTGGGPAVVSASTIDSDPATLPDGTVSDATPPGSSGSILSAQANPATWTNPEGTGTVQGQTIAGLPGTTLGTSPQDFDGNPATGAPARYYDVTLAASGTTTLSGATVTVDKLTVNGASANLTIGSTGILNTLISSNVFAGTLQVDGTLNTAGGLNMFGGVLQGTGTVNGPTGFLIGAVAPGTVGTIGTLKIVGAVGLGVGSTTVIDFTRTTTDLLQVTGAVSLSGTAMFTSLDVPQMGDAHTFLTATGTITGSYAAVPDTIAGVLKPVVTTVTSGALQTEVVTIQAGSFLTLLGSNATPDQLAIAGALDAARGAHYNDMLALYQAIDPLSDGALAQALENLVPDAARTGPGVTEMTTAAFDSILWQHLLSIGGSSSNGGQAGLQIDSDGLKSALNSATGVSAQSQQFIALGASIATNPGGGNDPIPTTGTAAATAVAPTDASMLSLPNGAGGFLTGSSLNGSVDVGGGGGKADVRGLIIAGGLDAPVGSGITLGGSIGYSDATTTLRASPAMSQTDGIQGALYARLDFGPNMIAEAYASVAGQSIQTRRVVVVGATTFNLAGHTDSVSPSLGLYLGRSFHWTTSGGTVTEIIPSAGLTFDSTRIDPYTETGGAPAMTFARFSRAGTTSRIGFDADTSFEVGSVRVSPNLHAFWLDDFASKNGSIDAAFAAAPSSIVNFSLSPRDSDYGEIGVGADVDLGAFMGTQATLSGRYDTVVGRDDASYGAWTGRLSIKF